MIRSSQRLFVGTLPSCGSVANGFGSGWHFLLGFAECLLFLQLLLCGCGSGNGFAASNGTSYLVDASAAIVQQQRTAELTSGIVPIIVAFAVF